MLPLLFGEEILDTKFYICDKLSENYDGILGWGFLTKNKVIIDCKSKCLSNEKFNIPYINCENQIVDINSIRVSDSTVGMLTKKHIIPPRSELIVKVKARNNLNSDCVFITPTNHSLASTWVVSKSVNSKNDAGEYFVKVANFSDDKIHINKGTKLVSIETIETVEVDQAEINLIEKEIDEDMEMFGGKFDLDHLNDKEKEQVLELINKHKNIFADSVKQLTGCDTVAHRIHLSDEIPVRQKPYRTPHALREELKNQVNQLLDVGIVSVSDSPYASPVILVKKKNNSYRLVCDYRKLNLKTQALPYPLPLISDLLDSLQGAKYYSSLDLCSGYWQMLLDPKDRHKTAFATEFGLFQWNRLPQGLKNAASSFQRLLEIVLAGLKDWNINTYIDDLIIASKTFDDHLIRLNLVFERLNKHNLKINPAKCQLIKKRINYLGFIIDNGKLFPDNRNVEVINNFPIPKNKTDVKSFIGLCNFYRKFIKNFAQRAISLTNLTKGRGKKIEWNEEANEAFRDLKNALVSYPCLLLPDVDKSFTLHTDASDYAIGAVLSQVGDDGESHPVGFASRKLKDAEVRYSTFEREALAVVWGIQNYRHYLYGRQFKIFCDQKSLSYALKLKDNGRIARWALALQNYDYEIIHTPGKENIPADALSRHVNLCETVHSVESFPASRIKELQKIDNKCNNILEKLETVSEIKSNKLKFFKKDNVLFCSVSDDLNVKSKHKLVIPETLISEILKLSHDSITVAHPGFKRTLFRIKKYYFWWGMNKHVDNYIKSCAVCIEKRGYKANQKAPIQRVEVGSYPFERVAMDAIGPLPITERGNKFILVIADYFSRFVEAYPVPNLTTEEVCFTLEKFICTHGIPKHLTTDRGSSFLSEAIIKVYSKLGIIKHSTTSYHPSSDGLVERANGTIINSLKALVENTNDEWDKYIHFALLAYKSAIHSAIRDTPSHLVFGRDLVLPIDLFSAPVKRSYAEQRDFAMDLEVRLQTAFQLVKKNLLTAAEKQEKDRLKKFKDKNIRVGDLVFLYTPAIKPGESKKFGSRNRGIYRVKLQTSPVNFQISHVNNPLDTQNVHIDRLTKMEERIVFPSLDEVSDNQCNNSGKMEFNDLVGELNLNPGCELIPRTKHKFRVVINSNMQKNVNKEKNRISENHRSDNSNNLCADNVTDKIDNCIVDNIDNICENIEVVTTDSNTDKKCDGVSRQKCISYKVGSMQSDRRYNLRPRINGFVAK